MSRTPSSANPIDPIIVGTIWGIVAAVGYTAANVFLRAVSHCDPVWVSCVKAAATAALAGPWLILVARSGQRVWPDAGVFGALAFAGLFGQLGGNVLFQWSLDIIGLAISAPLTLGSMILSSALLGRIYLKEPVTRQAATAIVVLVCAIAILSTGAGSAGDELTSEQTNFGLVAAGVAAACTCGFSYAVLGVVIRHNVAGKVHVVTTLVIISGTGMAALSLATLWTIGVEGVLATGQGEFVRMLLAGACNAAAFFGLVKALQLTTVIYVNSLNASQAAMAAVAGVWLFHEPLTVSLGMGVALTVAGLILMRRKKDKP